MFPSTSSSSSDLALWTTVFASIMERSTYHVYQDGNALSLELSDLPAARGRAKEAIRREILRKRKVEMAATAMYQIKTTTPEFPVCSVLNVWLSPISGISMEPPQQVQSSLHICEDTFETGVNVTPKGCFVDLHHGGFPLHDCRMS